MEWIEKEIENRRIIEKQNPLLFKTIVKILFKHDLMGIDYGDNTDEYEPEAGTIIPRLKECSSYRDVRKIVYEEFVRWFYDDVGEEEEYTEVAKEIWKVWVGSK